MCGIFGMQSVRGDIAPELLSRCTDLLAHRGPDDSGVHVNPDRTVGLGHRRLSIIDLSRRGRQPMSNEDGSLQLTFNGEIYNFAELRQELEGLGHRFYSRTDCEVVLHGYEAWGTSCLDRLRGMFAFAIWNESTRELFAARDRLGIKPFYYYLDNGFLAFASELRALTALPRFSRQVEPRSVADYLLYGYIPPPRSIWKRAFKLPAGHFLTAALGEAPRVKRYWDPDLTADNSRSSEEWLDGLGRLIDESVKLRMISDVPVGAFLSGGIDSSTVISHMGEGVRTFTIGFEEARNNEALLARQLARRYQTVHRERTVLPEDAQKELEGMAEIYDEPFADSSGVPMSFLSRMTREDVKVALSGDGGDELFGGYKRYPRLMQTRFLHRHLLSRRFAEGYIRFQPYWSTVGTYLSKVAAEPADALFEEVGIFDHRGLTRVLAPDLAQRLEGYDARQPMLKCLNHGRERGWDWLAQLRYCDLKLYLPEDILTKVDRVTMQVALEARVPLLDHKLVEYALKIPSALHIQGGRFRPVTKAMLRHHARDRIPRKHLSQPKRGFELPFAEWMRREFKERVLKLEKSPAPLNPPQVREVVRHHLGGQREFSVKLWAMLILDRWWKRWVL